jgi:ribonuclease HI
MCGLSGQYIIESMAMQRVTIFTDGACRKNPGHGGWAAILIYQVRTMDGQPVKNQDLWQKLEQAAGRHKVQWKWVRGHAGNPVNELCDRLAKEAIGSGLHH